MTEPKVDVPFDEALQDLSGLEVLAIQRHYGLDMERLGGIRSLIGTVWAYENRHAKVEWSTVERMTLRELNAYFAEPDEDPESDQGKERSTGE